ncbi:hypothetical protein NAC44_07210 [Allorhizobium sp. BGMRC 0089]|uniref:hypothetical protein n=1 Tax=Allorhizobium sonneratiae TaxID=2934936 RepID=UPI0020342497|nr:hypothetical protein [Allorhizobium sonneratiae]MCM2292120.1 hypothetical protein [Allorhizobium sonneratiae]
MTSIGQLLSASTLAAVAFGGAAPADSASSGSDHVETVRKPLSDKRFAVTRLSALSSSDPLHVQLAHVDPHSAQARHLQAAVIANPKLLHHVEKLGVDVTTIVAMAQSDDGLITVFTA